MGQGIGDALGRLKCSLGFHKPRREHVSFRHRYRTTNKGRSKKRYYSVKELYTITYCERCGKQLKTRRKLIWR